MPENKPQRLSDVLPTYAPEGANDVRWHLAEHQVEQAKISAMTAVGALAKIVQNPENAEEAGLADDCLSYMRAMLCDIQGHIASMHSCLSGTDVPERVSRKEV